MKQHIARTDTSSIATIERPDCTIAKGIISIDLHTNNSLTDQAVFACLPELLLSGTTKRKRVDILHITNALGADIHFSIADGVLTMQLTSTADAWVKTLKLAQEVLTNSMFPASEIKRVKQMAINDLHEEQEDASARALQTFRSEVFSNTDRRHMASEKKLVDAIKKLKKSDVQKMYERMLGSFVTASVVGNEVVCSAFSKTVATITPKKLIEYKSAQQLVTSSDKRLLLTDIPSRQNIDLTIGAALPLTPAHPDFLPFTFGLSVLAKWGGFAGRLMSTVREKEGLTYTIYGRAEGYTQHETGYFRILTFFNPAQVSQGITSTFREIKQIVTKGITEAEHKAFKTIIANQLVLQNDSPTTQVVVLHNYNKLGFSIEQITAHQTAAVAVTRTQVNAALKKYLKPQQLIISAAGPVTASTKELQALSKKL